MPTTTDNEPTSADNAESDRQSMPSDGEPTGDAEPKVPDWLLKVQKESTVLDTEEEPPDWLADLSDDASAEADLATVSEGQLPDWLKELEPEQAGEPSAETEDDATLQGDLPDWLIELSQEEGTEAPVTPLATPDEEPLAESVPQETQVQAQVEPEKSTKPLRAPADVERAAQDEQEGSEPEWFNELRQEAESAIVPEPAPEESLAAAVAPPVQADVPEGAQAEFPPDLAAEELPDWLRELEADILDLERPDLAAQARTVEAEAEVSEAPIESPPVRADETVEPEPESPGAPSEPEQPDWLLELDEAAAEPASEALLASEDEDEEMDWLYELEEEEEEEEALLPTFERVEEDQEIEWEDELEKELEPMSDGELPEWLQELRAESDLPQPALSGDRETELAPDMGVALEPMEDDELPGWLQELRPAEEPETVDAAPPAAEAEPEPAAESPEPEAEQIAEPALDLTDEVEELEWLRELEQTAPAETRAASMEAPAVEAPAAEQEPAAPSPVAQAPEPELAAPEPPVALGEELEAEPEPALAEPMPADQVALPQAQAQDTESRLSRARTSLSKRALDESAQEYERLVKDPDLASELVEELERAVQEHSDHHTLQRVLGDAYMRTGQLDKALAAYRQALSKL